MTKNKPFTPFTSFVHGIKKLIAMWTGMPGCTLNEMGFEIPAAHSPFKKLLKPTHNNKRSDFVDELFRRFDAWNIPKPQRPPRKSLSEAQAIIHLQKIPLPVEEVPIVRAKIEAIKTAVRESRPSYVWEACDILLNALKQVQDNSSAMTEVDEEAQQRETVDDEQVHDNSNEMLDVYDESRQIETVDDEQFLEQLEDVTSLIDDELYDFIVEEVDRGSVIDSISN